MTQETAQIITLAFTAITAIGALWAAFEAMRSARATQSIAEAQLLVHFLDDYASDGMHVSLQTLRNWESTQGPDFANIWYDRFQKREPLALELNKHRRKVMHYYIKVRLLRERGYVSRRFLSAVTGAGLGVMSDIVEPLEYVLDKRSKDLGTVKYLLKEMGEKESPILLPPHPITQKQSESLLGDEAKESPKE